MILPSKKGLADFITVGILLFITVITMWIVWTVFNTVKVIPIFSSTPEVTQIMNDGSSFIDTFNMMFPLLMFALNLYSIIALFFLDSHPVMFVVHMLMLPITVLIMAALSNSYETMIHTTTFAVANPAIDYIMMNLPKIMIGFDILGGIALFTVVRSRQ